jgi:hypothetical protein
MRYTRNDASDEFETDLAAESEMTAGFAVSGVVRAIVAEFGTDMIIYKEEAVENFKTPSFFVYQVDAHRNQQIGNDYRGLFSMEVRHHLPDGAINVRETLCGIANRLFSVLEKIELPSFDGYDGDGEIVESTRPVRARDPNYHIDDGVLFFDFDLDLHILRPYRKLDRMDELELNIEEI